MAPGGRAFENIWRTQNALGNLLLPLSWLFGALAGLRRLLFRCGLLRATRLPVPVVVIGNITVGGTGKTPLVISLVQALSRAGFHPGVLSRGYRGRYVEDAQTALVAGADPERFGDEIVLIQERTGVPAAVGRRRAQAGRELLAHHPEVDVLVLDDGLQHYAIARDVEVAVFDARGAGNGRLLPAGPLREPLARLARVDAVVCNGDVPEGALFRGAPDGRRPAVFRMALTGDRAYRLDAPDQVVALAAFQGRRLLAAAGIGSPERFFAMLRGAGLVFATLPLPDHFDYRQNPFQGRAEEVILITQKDAVKCHQLNDPRLWVVPVDAILEAGFLSLVLEKLRAWK